MQINVNKFYAIGVWCFGILAIVNSLSLYYNIRDGNYLYATMMIGAVVSLIFNYALFGFFYYLKSTLPPENIEKGTLADMEALVKE